MKPLFTLIWLFLATQWSIAHDPFFLPEQWEVPVQGLQVLLTSQGQVIRHQ